MAISLKHTKNVAKSDGLDSTVVQPSDWNAEHTLTAAAGRVLGTTTSTTTVTELPIAVDGSGNVGIGTSSPAAKLDVNGTIGINGSKGTSGQALISGGSSNPPSWGTLGVSAGGTGVTTSTGSGDNVLSGSPALTGTPTAPTANAYTNTAQLATTAQVYSTVASVPENAQTGTTYTLVASDKGKMVTLANAGAITLTVPANIFSTNDRVDLLQYGAGQVTVTAGAGLTLRSSGSNVKFRAQYSGASIWFKSATEAVLIGDLTA